MFVRFAICLDEADIAWVHGKAGPLLYRRAMPWLERGYTGKLRLRRLAAAANISYLAVDIRVFLIKGRLRYRSRCGKNLTCRVARCGTADVRLWHLWDMPTLLMNVSYQGKSGSDSDITKPTW